MVLLAKWGNTAAYKEYEKRGKSDQNDAMMAIFAARGNGLSDIVLTGNLTTIKPIRSVFENLQPSFGVNFMIPENAQFGTVIGTALYDM